MRVCIYMVYRKSWQKPRGGVSPCKGKSKMYNRMVIVDTRLRFREKPTVKFHRVHLKSNENEVYVAS